MKPSSGVFDLAGAILDGQRIDWESVDSSSSDRDRPLVQQLRILADLATLHRGLSDDPLNHANATSQSRSTAAPVLPATWGHLQLLEHVGVGHFGDVFRAWETRLDREVAVKLLDSSFVESGSAVIEEGRLLARVRHPNVVTVHGAERIDGRIGIWTEYVHGRTLEQVLEDHGPFSAEEASGIGVQVCRALAAVHAAGLLHRDVKAQNIMREEGGRIVLMDFGAGMEHLAPRDVRSVAGTPLYLAPEIFGGTPATAASDIYGVGVLLFHLVSGSYPVTGRSFEEIRSAHREGRHQLLRDLRPELSGAFIALVERALDANPAHRFSSAGALERALRTVAAHSLEERSFHRPTWRLVAAGAAALVAAAAIGLGGFRAARGRSENERQSGIQSVVAGTPLMRAVRMPQMGLFRAGTPSFDGRFYSNTDLNEDLMVVDLASATSRRLTDKGQSDEMAEFSAMSPDGQSIAYAWLTLDDVYELRVIGSNGSRPRVLVPRGHAEYVLPVEWSRDGSEILCLLYQRGGLVRMSLVRVSDGTIRDIGEFRGSVPEHVSLSSDKRYVVYDAPAEPTGEQRDIFIKSTEGGDARALVSHAANDFSPIWTPDGVHVFFVSDRTGTSDGWVVRVVDGAAQGEPVLAVRDIGRVVLSGFTAAGTLYYWRQTGLVDVFIVPLDGRPATRVPPTRVASRFVGSNIGPAWSPDGRYLAYVSQRSTLRIAGASVLVVHDTRTGTDREIVPDLALGVLSPRWSSDGRQLLVQGNNRHGQTGVFIIDVDGGRVTPGLVVDLAHATDIGNQFGWWVDGQSIVYNAPSGIAVRNPASGTDVRPFASTQSLKGFRIAQFDLSPDRRSLAFSAIVAGTEPPARVVAVMPLDGSPRELVRAVNPDQVFLQGWMPNGRELLFTRRRLGVDGPHDLWRVSVDDARATDTHLAIPGFTQVNRVQVDPGGHTVAYTTGQASWALWVLENFLQPQPR